MPSYRIVVDREPPRHQSILWIDREDDKAALITAAEALSPSEIGQVWENERSLSCPFSIGRNVRQRPEFLVSG
jgi:hypothetical protein